VEASPATTTSENVNAKSQPEPWEWSPGDRLEFSRELQAINDSLLEPTEDVMRYVLAHMQGPEDARLWVWSLKARGVKRNKPGWGLLRDEARKWDSDRVSVRRQVDAQRAVMEAEARANAEAEAAASSENEVAMKIYEQQQREQQEFIDAAEARGWPRDSKSICLFCYGFGRCDVATGAICDCESGRKLKLKLEQDRARVRNNPAAPKPTDSPPTREPPAVREPARHRHGAQMVSR
jgi:hypothetical protein